MMKRALHRALSLLLTAAMVLSMGISPVFAAGAKVCTCEPAIGASDVGHGEDCPLYAAPE